jgi:hypothetical protein
MPKSEYFQHVDNTNERNLLLELTQEVVNHYGVDVYFIPNNYVNVDKLYGEDRKPDLSNAIKIVVYIAHAQTGYDGSAAFSKFGFFNPSNIDLTVSRKEWEEVAVGVRPMEGSIIYIPSWDTFGPTDFLKVDFVDKFATDGFFPLGVHPSFTLQCSKWAYSSETLNTGVPEIDVAMAEFSNDTFVNPNMNPTDVKDNTEISKMGETIIDFDETNPFGAPPKGLILNISGVQGSGAV